MKAFAIYSGSRKFIGFRTIEQFKTEDEAMRYAEIEANEYCNICKEYDSNETNCYPAFYVTEIKTIKQFLEICSSTAEDSDLMCCWFNNCLDALKELPLV